MTAIALNRKQAAAALGVTVNAIKEAQARGDLRAKNTKIDKKTGRPVGTTLYAVTELQRWFDSLEDA